jgi:nucleoside-diphosphate-sugar epimerase
MKVLVTGATGFTGSHLARKLYHLGHDVRILVRDKGKVLQSKDFDPEIFKGDIRDSNSVELAVKGIDIVYHIAAMYRTAGIADRVYWETHVEGTKILLKASFKSNVNRFVHCSTVGVHGHIENPPASENYPFNPGDIYQLTKLKGEQAVLRFTKETGLPVVVIRPCAIYGPGDMRLLKLFKIASQRIIPILGNGEISYHMVYIDDLIDAFILSAVNENANGESIIIGGEECYSLNQLVDLIDSVLNLRPTKIHLPVLPIYLISALIEKICIPLGIPAPIYRRRVAFFTKSRNFDISKSKKLLGFAPKINLFEGIKRTAIWYNESDLL